MSVLDSDMQVIYITRMTFQAYIDTIYTKTGKKPEDIKAMAEKAKILHTDMKASEFVAWLKKEFGLGHGHCMALWGLFIWKGWITTSYSKMSKTKTKK